MMRSQEWELRDQSSGTTRGYSPIRQRCSAIDRLSPLLLLTMALLLAAILAGCPAKDPAGSTAHAEETVERSYELHCVGCHGDKGQGAWGSNIQGLTTSVEEIAVVIANGAEKMPAYKGHLSEEQIRELAEYVKAFK